MIPYMQIPDFLKPFVDAAETYLSRGLVRDIEFSGETYQVQVVDPTGHKEVWAFLQLDSRGQIKDCFCSCEEAEEFSPCVHLAAAFLKIYNGQQSPLNVRFEHSLWNALCSICAENTGYGEAKIKSKDPGHYFYKSTGGKLVFSLKAKKGKAAARLKEIIEAKHRETEETSLKFSNLSAEEIALWREGRPSSQLSYELSFWNDLAKWMMAMQDDNLTYDIEFEYSPKNIPNRIKIAFPDLTAEFTISEDDLPRLIPTLATVKTPLAVYNDWESAIEKITYDRQSGTLNIISKAGAEEDSRGQKIKNAQEIAIGNWLYVPGDGFYAKTRHSLLQTPQLAGEQIAEALNNHLPIIRTLLKGTKINAHPVTMSYVLSFDQEWNLHIMSYVAQAGDLSTSDARKFGNWVYLDNAFQLIDGVRFDEIDKVIPCGEVADFVTQNRGWLINQEGFRTYLASLEAQMTYDLTPDNRLSFSRRINVKDEAGQSKDFGSWVYVVGQGFYSKVTSHIGLPLRPGIDLNADQIPVFIHANKEELQLVPGFFSERCPVIKSGLRIELLKDETVEITPVYELLPEYRQRPVRYFDDVVYVEGEGFHELPVDTRLPERYRHIVHIEPANMAMFLTSELDAIIQYATYIDPRLLKPANLTLTATSIVKEESEGKGWYGLKLAYQTTKGTESIATMWGALKDKKRFFFSNVGLIDLHERRYNWLRLLGKKRIDRRSNLLLLSTLELIRLNAFDEIEVRKGKGGDYDESRRLLKELTDFEVPDEPDTTGMGSQLRPYQEKGLHWLWFLYHHGLSGMLCDDMGLGKTHQAMALLAAIINYRKKLQAVDPTASPTKQSAKRHFLVVCPTSVIYHWMEKLETFMPGIRVCVFYGINRSMGEFHKEYDVLLTSYGIWRNENEVLGKLEFDVAIFDEIQVAKNYSSIIHGALLMAKANMKLGLTGTPIENNLRELKSLFDIVLPTYMPSEHDFREFFIKPIEKESNADRRELLSRFIKPFILRRKKGDVLLDLPEKIEEIAHCDLMPRQQLLYVEVLERAKRQIIYDLQDDRNPIPYIHIFALLASLKQICDHPAVYHKDPANYKAYQSGKWDLFVELLSEARESQQKVVIFSQYLTMLDILEAYLKETGMEFATIRGSTMDRGEQVRRFNKDPKCEVFLGSLQAAGLGIDLTAGSVVIHYDRWWNAARENQATDRVHRIGQTRGVQVFKLVTKGTFEEKIDLMIAKKGRLMEDVVGIDDHEIVKKFTRDDLIQLLEYTGRDEKGQP